jgi:hypothetical protein
MSRHAKQLASLLSGASDQTIRFDSLCALLRCLGFMHRQSSGSHRIFYRAGIAEILNIQPRRDGTAKPYQVKQIREIILRYTLTIPADPEANDGR